jgi:hypothetical protein
MDIAALQGMHGRVFIRTGVSFGTAMGVMQLIQGRVLFALLVAPTAGVLFGGSMAFMSHRAERRLVKLGFKTDSMDPIQRRAWHTDQPVDAAFSACNVALGEIRKLLDVQPNSSAQRIEAKTGVTWQSFGELIVVELEEDAGGTIVRVQSEPRWKSTVADSGKGVENVERFGQALLTHLPDARPHMPAMIPLNEDTRTAANGLGSLSRSSHIR